MAHNKKRNPAVIYEILTKEAAIALSNNEKQRSQSIVALLKEHFRKGTELRKELDLFNSLLSTKLGLTISAANRLIEQAKDEKKKINEQKLENEKGILIAKVNRQLGQGVWNNFIPNYRSLASISQIFDQNVPLKSRVLLEERIIEELTGKKDINEAKMEPLTALQFKMFIRLFNEKYGKSTELLQEQKDLLQKFVMSFSDRSELNMFLYEEIGRLKRGLKEHQKERREDVTKIISLLESINPNMASEEQISTVFRCQVLLRELENDQD